MREGWKNNGNDAFTIKVKSDLGAAVTWFTRNKHDLAPNYWQACIYRNNPLKPAEKSPECRTKEEAIRWAEDILFPPRTAWERLDEDAG